MFKGFVTTNREVPLSRQEEVLIVRMIVTMALLGHIRNVPMRLRVNIRRPLPLLPIPPMVTATKIHRKKIVFTLTSKLDGANRRIKALRFGLRGWAIAPAALEAVRVRVAGRPWPKKRETAKARAEIEKL